jgi:hypothetical protein
MSLNYDNNLCDDWGWYIDLENASPKYEKMPNIKDEYKYHFKKEYLHIIDEDSLVAKIIKMMVNIIIICYSING